MRFTLKRFGVFILFVLVVLYFLYPKEPIKVGLLSVLSGRNSQLGVFARDGVNLLVNKINKQGGINGRKIKLYIEDNQGDPETNKEVIQKLLSQDVNLILGPLTSNMAEPTIEALKNKNAMALSPTISLDKVKDLDDNFIRTNSIASLQGVDISKLSLDLGSKTASAIIDAPNKAYTQPVFEAFKEKFEKAGGSVRVLKLINQTKTTNFLTLASEINQTNSDLLIIVTSGIDAASIIQQTKKLNDKIQFICSMWSKTKDVIVHGGKAVEGAYFVGKYETTQTSEKKLAFQKEFLEVYKSNPSFISVMAYEAADVMFKAIKEAKDTDPMAVRKKILEISRFQGLDEEFVINRFGDTDRKNSLFIVKNGKFRLITK